MGSFTDHVTPEVAAFVAEQRLFFVGTAPSEGHINVSPKGWVRLHVLSPNRVAYVDYPGSGDETAIHLRENGRITLMLCSFGEKPLIVRFYGTGRVLSAEEAGSEGLRFPETEQTGRVRHVFVVDVQQVQRSCGYGVPLFEYRGERPQAVRMAGADAA